MINSTLRLTLLALLVSLATALTAQVRGISYTISPQVSYNWFDDQSGLDNGFLFGGSLGIGFGEMVELRALYMRDFGLQRDFDGILDQDIDDLLDRDAAVQRYGGEVRLNLGRSALLPYLTLGAGIQETELDGGLTNENIYASGGLGITLSILDRFTLRVEGKNTTYNFNTVRNFLTEDELNMAGIGDEEFNVERLSNWSLGAGLTFYLGGRRPGQLSDVDEAYAAAFDRGFAGLSLIVEPTLSRINFNDELAYRDTYLGGASLGLDFGPYVGVRGFYYRSMENDEINFDFDNMDVYGGDFRFRLGSVTNGLSPFITLGGGYISLDDDYVGREGAETSAVSQAFASGGGGLSLNLNPNFRLLGTYRALLTSGNDLENIRSEDQILVSNQWTAGLILAFGKRAQRPDAILANTADERLERQREELNAEKQRALAEQARENAEDTRELRQDYEERLSNLQGELEGAYAMSDRVKIDSLETAIAETEEVVDNLEEREAKLNKTASDVEQETAELERRLNDPEYNARRRVNTYNTPASSPNNRRSIERDYDYDYNFDGNPDRMYNRNGNNRNYNGSQIVMSVGEFQNLVEEIFEGLNGNFPVAPNEYTPREYANNSDRNPQEQRNFTTSGPVQQRLNELEQEVRRLNDRQQQLDQARQEDKEQMRREMRQSTDSILEELRELRDQMNQTDRQRRKQNKN